MITTILTGQRPQLLKRTLGSLVEFAPECLQDQVLVFHNSGDKETSILLDQCDFIDTVIVTDELLSIGEAYSRIAEELPNDDIWLNLEDDWECRAGGWLEDSKELLKGCKQVRLRLEQEKVQPVHMVTGRPLEWTHFDTLKWAKDAHLTFNPSLLHTSTAKEIFPCTGETDAQRNAWMTYRKFPVAQIIPGAFKHIGEGKSLRMKTRCEK